MRQVGEEGTVESGSLYFLSGIEHALLKLRIGSQGGDEDFAHYIELNLNYMYYDEELDEMVEGVMPSLCLDMNALVELNAVISASMVRLEDAGTRAEFLLTETGEYIYDINELDGDGDGDGDEDGNLL